MIPKSKIVKIDLISGLEGKPKVGLLNGIIYYDLPPFNYDLENKLLTEKERQVLRQQLYEVFGKLIKDETK